VVAAHWGSLPGLIVVLNEDSRRFLFDAGVANLAGGRRPRFPIPMAEDTSRTAPVRGVVLWGRRFLAATVVVPPDLAKLLNTDALAVLAVIRDEARATGKCTLPVARIAERANIGRAKTRAAIRLAEYLGLIAIEQEPGQERAIINRGVKSRC
jgi:hypothetical protein